VLKFSCCCGGVARHAERLATPVSSVLVVGPTKQSISNLGTPCNHPITTLWLPIISEQMVFFVLKNLKSCLIEHIHTTMYN
jgi:hypothetical protein